MFDHAEFAGHEGVHFLHDAATGLRAIIAVHWTRGGRCGGGVRFKPYASIEDALGDALRLSRAMSYKMALVDLPIGGGKSVIIGDPVKDKTPALLRAFGRRVDELGGRYVCGPDVGTNDEDMGILGEVTDHVAGKSGGGATAGPTADGVFEALKAAAAFRFGEDTLSGRTIAVQGLGGVGRRLCALLHAHGASLTVADTNPRLCETVAQETGAQIVPPDRILFAEVDILAPCALGGVLARERAHEIKAAIVCGAANNQLADDAAAGILRERGVLYAPDYVVNAGGALAGAAETLGLGAGFVADGLKRIAENLTTVLKAADAGNISTEAAARSLAEEKIRLAGQQTSATSP